MGGGAIVYVLVLVNCWVRTSEKWRRDDSGGALVHVLRAVLHDRVQEVIARARQRQRTRRVGHACGIFGGARVGGPGEGPNEGGTRVVQRPCDDG